MSRAHEKLTEEQIAEIRKAFSVCDKDGSNSIDGSELKNVMKEMGENPTEEETAELLKELDTDGNGVISWDEFLNAMADWLTEAD